MSKVDDLLKEKQELIDELEYLKTEKVKEKARNDFVSFCEFVIKDELNSSRIKLAELQKTWIRHIAFCKKHNLNCLILAPMSSGKCVAPDTQFVEKARGNVPASNLQAGDTVLSYDEDSESSCWSKVVAVEPQAKKLAVLVRTLYGRSLVVTADHKFLTVNGWEEAQDLIPNKSVLLGPLDWNSDGSTFPDVGTDIMYGLGVWAALEDSPYVGVFEDVSKIEAAYRTACDKSFQSSRYLTSSKYRKQVCTRIKSYTIGSSNSHSVDKLCKEMLSASKEQVSEFLGGYYDLNGKYVRRGSEYQIFGTYQRISGIQLLLAYVGVESKIVRQFYLGKTCNKVLYKLVILRTANQSFTHNIKSKRFAKEKTAADSLDTTLDTVISTKYLEDVETIGVEVEGTHTHVTNGVYSHNTQIIAVALPLYFLGKNPSCRIKMVCLSDKAAKERLGAIRAYIAGDEDYKSVFPHVKPDKNQEWTRHTIYVERDTIAKDASIDTYGVISSGIGGRCDLLIVDDIFDQRTAVSQPATREQIIATFNQVWLSRVEPAGQVVIICTRWHELDLAGDILADEGKLKRYGVLIQRVSDDMTHINCEVLVPDSIAHEYQSLDPNYHAAQS